MGRIDVLVRDEVAGDVESITDITKAAFENHPFSQQTEHFIIKALRAAGALSISLVAEVGGEVVGHIAFSPVEISDGSCRWYGLGPVSVLPNYQRQGIGTALINEGLARLKSIGANGCMLVGDPGYYERFGFKSPSKLCHEGVPQENFMAVLFDGEMPEGMVEFHKSFWVKS